MLPTQLFWSLIVLKLKSFNFVFSNISEISLLQFQFRSNLTREFMYHSATFNL